jgi:uncharacterized MAPEG superfamily protein
MTSEFRMLAWSVLLGIVQLMIATHLATKQYGMKWNLSPRDKKVPELIGLAGRMDRVFKNFMQTFPFFAAAILLVQVSQRLTVFTAIGAQLYFYARIVYIPLYAAGIPGVRSAVWTLSMVGVLMVLWPMLVF